jgi:mRNA interferase RelE/StbE
MKYSLVITPKAERAFLALDKTLQARITEAMNALSVNPRPHGCLKMSGEDSYRVRVGKYRIVYEIHDRTITVIVVKIAHRREAYR